MDLKDRLNRLKSQGGPGSSGTGGDSSPQKKTLDALIKKPDANPGMRRHESQPQELLTHYGGPEAQSLESMRIAFSTNPDNLGIGNVLAGMLYTAQEYREAAEIYQRILQKDPADGKAWLQLANCQVAQEAWQDAFRSYVWALQYIDDPVLKQKCQERMSAVEQYIQQRPPGDGSGESFPW